MDEKEKSEKEAAESIEERARSISAVNPTTNVNEISTSQVATITSSDFNVSLSLRMAAISASLTVEKPVRREFLSI